MLKSLLFLTFVALIPTSGHAACSVMARPGTQATLNGVLLVGGKRLEPCTGELIVTRGEAAACAIKSAGSPECKAIKEGNQFRLASLDAKTASDLTNRMVAVFNGLRAQDIQEGGRKALGEGVAHDLPTDEVVVLTGDLVITPNLAATGALSRFQLSLAEKPNAVLVKLLQVSGDIHIPRKALQPGENYVWRVTSANHGEMRGEFSLVDPSRTTKLQQELQESLTQSDSEFARMLIEAMVYDDYGLAWNRDHLLNRARN